MPSLPPETRKQSGHTDEMHITVGKTKITFPKKISKRWKNLILCNDKTNLMQGIYPSDQYQTRCADYQVRCVRICRVQLQNYEYPSTESKDRDALLKTGIGRRVKTAPASHQLASPHRHFDA
jgi:hypothetical protein